MGTTTDKLNKILESKAAIKAAIEAKGVSDVGDVLSAYPDKIASIKSGGYTGHADAEGLKAIGWTDEDIQYYQENGVDWNEEEDKYHKVPQNNIDLYGVLTIYNIQDYKYRIIYLPKIDTSGVVSMKDKFMMCRFMIAVPQLNTSIATDMSGMFSGCQNLKSIPLFDTSNVTNMEHMFDMCSNLKSIPLFDTSNVTNMSGMFMNTSIQTSLPPLDTSNVTNMENMFSNCNINAIPFLNVSNAIKITNILTHNYTIQTANLYGLRASIKIDVSQLLTKESLLYIIQNAAPTEPIIITLSAYCYNKYNADPDVVAALSKQPNVSLASV